MTDDQLTPHGQLLESARGSTSKREAARRADISEGRWRQIVTGVQKVGKGQTIPANPKRETLIAMAKAVGLDPNVVLRAAGFALGAPTVQFPARGLGPTAPEDTPLKDASNALIAAEVAHRLTGKPREFFLAPEESAVEQIAAYAGTVDTDAITNPQDEIETGDQDPGDMEPR